MSDLIRSDLWCKALTEIESVELWYLSAHLRLNCTAALTRCSCFIQMSHILSYLIISSPILSYHILLSPLLSYHNIYLTSSMLLSPLCTTLHYTTGDDNGSCWRGRFQPLAGRCVRYSGNQRNGNPGTYWPIITSIYHWMNERYDIIHIPAVSQNKRCNIILLWDLSDL